MVQEDQVDSRFNFFRSGEAQLLNDILARRSPTLISRLQESRSVSRSDADEIMALLGQEFTDNLDDDWEPTEYGRTVSSLQAHFSTARIEEWPE